MKPAAPDGRVLRLLAVDRSRHQLAFRFGIGDLRFASSQWYDTVDLHALEARYGRAFLDRLAFHVAAFEINKIASLRPTAVDWGPWSRFATPAFTALWRAVFHHVWAQWRFENDAPHAAPPPFVATAPDDAPAPVEIAPGPVDMLAFCGGGKDSLVAAHLLARADTPFDTFAYSHAIYGAAAPQHRLIDGLVDHLPARRRHRAWGYDDFLDSPVIALCGADFGARSLTAAETPASIFAALPIILSHGHRHLVLGHEASANVGNLVWSATGEDVNHQWGKSYAAECLLNDYLATHLVANARYFSILQPIHDVLIFDLLRDRLDAVPSTHSCNVAKPWCKRCAKCAYVWVNYLAHLPESLVDGMFEDNLFDAPENRLHFEQMLGLGAHTPFECIGQIDEARLAFALCAAKGRRGAALDAFRAALPDHDPRACLDRYLSVDDSRHGIPPALAEKLLPLLRARAVEARARIVATLG